MPPDNSTYGIGDGSYQAAGELAGLTTLVDAFYDYMDTLVEARTIRAMHPPDLTESRRKLAYFLSGWLGGPKIFSQHYGPISIPRFHQHLTVDEAQRDAWLFCMAKAIADQPYADSFKSYLLTQLRVPAERVRQASAEQASKPHPLVGSSDSG